MLQNSQHRILLEGLIKIMGILMNDAAKSRHEDMLQGLHHILQRMVAERGQHSRLSDQILVAAVFAGQVADEDYDLFAEELVLVAVFDGILDVVEDQAEGSHEDSTAVDYLLS